MRALALNAGSTTLKASLYELDAGAPLAAPSAPLWREEIDAGEGAAPLLARFAGGAVQVVGHRVVHGGVEHRSPTPLTNRVKQRIAALGAWAPLHNAAALRGIEAAERVLGPDVPQVAVFDTTFHADLPPAAYAYAGPHEWLDAGLRRFGFHGINHEYVAHRAAELIGRPITELRMIICHLGGGCSLAAVRGGRSVDTTMGFTPLEGPAMATRSGSIDPGLLLHLLRSADISAAALDEVLNHRSGLAGLAGGSGDLRDVLTRRARGEARATLAFDVYIHRLRRSLGAMLASLGGLDAIAFTAGVGEHAPEVRAALLAPFAFLGIELDPQANAGSPRDADLATPRSRVRVLVVPAREDWAIARSAAQALARAV